MRGETIRLPTTEEKDKLNDHDRRGSAGTHGVRKFFSDRIECGSRKSSCLQRDLAAFLVLGCFGWRSEWAPSLAQSPR